MSFCEQIVTEFDISRCTQNTGTKAKPQTLIAAGDAFLSNTVNQIMSSRAWTGNSVIFIAWDESDFTGGGFQGLSGSEPVEEARCMTCIRLAVGSLIGPVNEGIGLLIIGKNPRLQAGSGSSTHAYVNGSYNSGRKVVPTAFVGPGIAVPAGRATFGKPSKRR